MILFIYPAKTPAININIFYPKEYIKNIKNEYNILSDVDCQYYYRKKYRRLTRT